MGAKIGIVEDELIIAENLNSVLNKLGYETHEPATSYEEAIAMQAEFKPELVLLDVNLGGAKTGIDIGMHLKSLNVGFIYLTSYSDKATLDQAKNTMPEGYLTKPFTRESLFTTIEIALNNRSDQSTDVVASNSFPDALFVKVKNLLHKVLFAEIVFIKSDHVYIEVHTKEDKFLTRATLSEVLEKLPSDKFIQVHRSYVINKDFLEAINTTYVITNNEHVPVGRKYRSELLKKLESI